MDDKLKDKIIIILLSLFILGFAAYFIITKFIKKDESKSADNLNITTSAKSEVESVNWDKYENKDITLSKSTKITAAGVYTLTGSISDGYITIDTDGDVKLILNNVSVINSTGPALYVKNANIVEIETLSGTSNTFTDGSKYNFSDEDANSCIFSHDDIIFSGSGTLNVNANYNDGIASKDNLKITSGNYVINSADDAIRGKDSVEITGGAFNITSGGDAIKSTNDNDAEKGFILITDGTFNIDAKSDGFDAETDLQINNGTFNIKTGDGASTSSDNLEFNKSKNSSSDDSSKKGIKAGNNIVITNGEFNINSSDDSVHSNNSILINGGTYVISSGDDGVHADSTLYIKNGTITINQSYEGLEASNITIDDGVINVTSSDDGINVAGGNDQSSMNRQGENNFSSSSQNKMTINGGLINVSSSGDGLDANGSIYINCGDVIVNGPTDNGNGALDYDKEFVITGGSIIAAGSSGMAQGISQNSKIYGVLIYFTKTYSENTKITIVDSSNNIVSSYTSKKSLSSIAIANEDFKNGYKVLVDGEEYTSFKISSISTTVGSENRVNDNRGFGGRR